ncbi:MAG TPA: carbon storage regulator [Gemmatimonadaceae bacterium]|nr:carbon storage regulator [Gemmatimonadaceae bacterium]
MLILGRRPGESIVIDGGIRIIVISSDRRGVRLGIEAPSHVGIVRGEIVAQIADENRRANVPAGSEWLAALAGGSPPPGDDAAPGDARRPEPGDPENEAAD